MFEYTLHNEPLVTYKNSQRGRPSATLPLEKVPVTTDRFRIDLRFNQSAYDQAISRGRLLSVGHQPARIEAVYKRCDDGPQESV